MVMNVPYYLGYLCITTTAPWSGRVWLELLWNITYYKLISKTNQNTIASPTFTFMLKTANNKNFITKGNTIILINIYILNMSITDSSVSNFHSFFFGDWGGKKEVRKRPWEIKTHCQRNLGYLLDKQDKVVHLYSILPVANIKPVAGKSYTYHVLTHFADQMPDEQVIKQRRLN